MIAGAPLLAAWLEGVVLYLLAFLLHGLLALAALAMLVLGTMLLIARP